MGSSESSNAANARLRLEALLTQGTGSSRSPRSGQRLLIAVKWLWYLILVEDKAFLDGPNTLAQLYPNIGLVQSYQSYAALRATGAHLGEAKCSTRCSIHFVLWVSLRP